MSNEELEVMIELVEEEAKKKETSKQDVILDVLTTFMKSHAELMKSVGNVLVAASEQQESIANLNNRLSAIELVILPHLKEIKGTWEC
jgi:hypothetical protein